MSGNQQNEINRSLNSIDEAIEDIKNGKIIIVVDDYDRENGYVDEEELFEQNKKKYTDMLFYIYRIMMENNYTSFNVCEDTDVIAYIDYLIFVLENPTES